MNKEKSRKNFEQLNSEDLDLTMFTITNLTLTKKKNANMVIMALKLKRKVAMELLTTYLPTILLLIITFVTIFFDKDLFGDAIAVNLTIMLVMTTIFTSKIEELPPTSDMKMIDIWLIFCLVVPFTEVILRTSIECMNCNCHICEPKDAKDEKEDKKKEVGAIQAASSGEVSNVWVGTGAKVAPQKVVNFFAIAPQINPCQVVRKADEGSTEAKRTTAVETDKPKEAVARAGCWKGSLSKGLQ